MDDVTVSVALAAEESIAAVIPASTPLAVYDVQVSCDAGDKSNVKRINAPRVFWGQVSGWLDADIRQRETRAQRERE